MIGGFDVVTFGGAVVDVFLDTDLAESKGKLCYNVGEKILVKDLKFDVGGGGTNTAAAFARLGFNTGCITKVGDDDNGKRILDCLKNEKVKFLGKIEKNGKSGYSVILDSREHERTILTYKGSNDNISMEDIDYFRTRWLYLSSLLEKSFTTQINLAKKLYNKGTKIAFNPSQYLITKYNLSPLLRICDVLILNKEEAQLLTKKNNEKNLKVLLKALSELGPKIVVITDKDNPAGCYDSAKNKFYFITPHKNIKVVERTGAGDAFASGFVAGQMAGFSVEKSLELALKESESVLKYFGAKNNLLRRKII